MYCYEIISCCNVKRAIERLSQDHWSHSDTYVPSHMINITANTAKYGTRISFLPHKINHSAWISSWTIRVRHIFRNEWTGSYILHKLGKLVVNIRIINMHNCIHGLYPLFPGQNWSTLWFFVPLPNQYMELWRVYSNCRRIKLKHAGVVDLRRKICLWRSLYI